MKEDLYQLLNNIVREYFNGLLHSVRNDYFWGDVSNCAYFLVGKGVTSQ
jgi:hypothetical protein